MILPNLPQYDILPNGTVWDLKHNRQVQLQERLDGYIIVKLYDNATHQTQSYYVHRLVAMAFLPNPNNLPCINHKNENKADNNVNNLEWCSYAYNNNYGTRSLRQTQTKEKKGYTIPHTAVQVAMVDKTTKQIIQTFNSVKEAGRFLQVSPTHINEAAHGKRKSAYGYYWTMIQ